MDGTTQTGFIAEIFDWAKKLFTSPISPYNLILILGLFAILGFLWNTVLLQLRNEI